MTTAHTATAFYASGTKGKEMRGDGNCGLLARGWYIKVGQNVIGPFKSAALAKAGAA